MTAMLPETLLKVFWKGDEVPGIICYGYWPSRLQPEVPFPEAPWPEGTTYADHWLHNWQEGSSEWRVLRRDIPVPGWPAQHSWLACVRRTLESFLEDNAQVAWCATEGHFADPPDLFDPAGMEGGDVGSIREAHPVRMLRSAGRTIRGFA
jgi:hypothetical protein